MNLIAKKLGFWSALLFTIMGVGYETGMGIFFTKYSIPKWTTIESYAEFMKSIPQLLFTICQITAFLSGLIFLILLCCIHEFAKPDRKILTRIGLCFGIIFVTLASITYFIQFTVIPQNIANASLQGLEQYVELNTKSFSASIVILGWGLFLPIALFFTAPVFSEGKLMKSIKWSFITTGVFCFISLLGYMFQIVALGLIATALYGVTLTLASILLCFFFKKLKSM